MKLIFYNILFLFFISTSLRAQPETNHLLDGVISNYNKVKNYQADIKIVTDIPFINIMPMKAKLYFRQPDQIRVVSKGIAILPRQGFDQMYKALIDRKSYTVIPQGTDTVERINVSVISILPLNDTMEIILGKFWIDPVRNVIVKSQMTSRTNGTVVASYVYGNYASYGLPDRMTFTVEVKKFKIPKTVAVDINTTSKTSTQKVKDPKKGKIEINLSGYIINKGVPGAVFEKEEESR